LLFIFTSEGSIADAQTLYAPPIRTGSVVPRAIDGQHQSPHGLAGAAHAGTSREVAWEGAQSRNQLSGIRHQQQGAVLIPDS
jgi:hypothetical protein